MFMLSLQSKNHNYAAVVGNPGVQINNVSQPSIVTADSNSILTTCNGKLSWLANSHPSTDRKFNVVVSSIPECRAGLSPRQRWISDVNQIKEKFFVRGWFIPWSSQGFYLH